MNDLFQRSYFFDNGIYFECIQCGACCTGAPGVIYVNESEIRSISDFLNMDMESFKQQHLYPFNDRFSIREHADGRCLFFDEGCKIYPVRPTQCRTFPFWFQNLRSEKKWHAIKKECPGIGKGRHYGKKEILEILNQTP